MAGADFSIEWEKRDEQKGGETSIDVAALVGPRGTF